MPRPVFVVTAPRSGSTFVVSLLASHERVAMTVEAAWFTFLRKTLLLASTPSSRVIDDGEGFVTPGILPERYVRDFHAAYTATMRPFLNNLFHRVADHFDFFGDKVTSANDLEFLIKHFPDAAFVNLVRDPRDVIASTYAFQQQQPAAWQDAAFDVRVKDLNALMQRTAEMLADRDTMLLRYEDLMTALDEKTAELFGFLGLHVTPAVRAFLEGEAPKLFASHGTSASTDASIGRWARDLDAAQQAAVNAGFREQLERFGYAVA